MGRPPPSFCHDDNLKKGPWTSEEDDKLVGYIDKHGHGSWRALPKLAGLNRCGKSCRLRWTNYLRPDIKRGKFSPEEEQTILNLHSILGNKWSAIAGHLPGRTDNEIKNFWNTHLKKKLIQMGFDPMTHLPRTDIFSSLPHLLALANLGEMMYRSPWEDHSVQMAKLQCLQYLTATTSTSPPTTLNLGNMEPVFLPPPSILEQQQPQQLQMIPASIINETNDHDDQLLDTLGNRYNTQVQQTPSLMNNTGDVCSTFSYDVCGTPNSLWNDLFLDDILLQ